MSTAARPELAIIESSKKTKHTPQEASSAAEPARLSEPAGSVLAEFEHDAERAGRALLERCSQLPELERAAVELVDVAGLTPKEAAAALGLSRVVLRKRLSRARARLRKEHLSDE